MAHFHKMEIRHLSCIGGSHGNSSPSYPPAVVQLYAVHVRNWTVGVDVEIGGGGETLRPGVSGLLCKIGSTGKDDVPEKSCVGTVFSATAHRVVQVRGFLRIRR